MNWTKDKPTIPGFYWMRNPGERLEVVEIDNSTGSCNLNRVGTDWPHGVCDFPNAEWAGPLEPPT